MKPTAQHFPFIRIMGLSVLFGLLGLMMPAPLSAKSSLDEGSWAKVDATDLRLRSGPSSATKILGVMEDGEKVKILGRSKKTDSADGVSAYWYKVERKNGSVGWLFGSYLKPIATPVAVKKVERAVAAETPKPKAKSNDTEPATPTTSASTSKKVVELEDGAAYAAVTASSVTVRVGTGAKSSVVGRVQNGQVVKILESSRSIYSVGKVNTRMYKVSSGIMIGWVPGVYLQEADEEAYKESELRLERLSHIKVAGTFDNTFDRPKWVRFDQRLIYLHMPMQHVLSKVEIRGSSQRLQHLMRSYWDGDAVTFSVVEIQRSARGIEGMGETSYQFTSNSLVATHTPKDGKSLAPFVLLKAPFDEGASWDATENVKATLVTRSADIQTSKNLHKNCLVVRYLDTSLNPAVVTYRYFEPKVGLVAEKSTQVQDRFNLPDHTDITGISMEMDSHITMANVVNRAWQNVKGNSVEVTFMDDGKVIRKIVDSGIILQQQGRYLIEDLVVKTFYITDPLGKAMAPETSEWLLEYDDKSQSWQLRTLDGQIMRPVK